MGLCGNLAGRFNVTQRINLEIQRTSERCSIEHSMWLNVVFLEGLEFDGTKKFRGIGDISFRFFCPDGKRSRMNHNETV